MKWTRIPKSVKHSLTPSISIVIILSMWKTNFRCTMGILFPFYSGQHLSDMYTPAVSLEETRGFYLPLVAPDVKEKVYKHITIWYCLQCGSPSLTSHPVRELVNQATRSPRGLQGGDSDDEREKQKKCKEQHLPSKTLWNRPGFWSGQIPWSLSS